jgi:hypothetical protein
VWPNGDALGTDHGGEGAHLVVYRGVRVRAGSTVGTGWRVWTSALSYWLRGRPHEPDSVAIGTRSIAFSFWRGKLWISGIGGTEHAVARDEEPVLWTKSGDLVTGRFRSPGVADLRLRGPSGSLIRSITQGAHRYAVDRRDRSLLFLRDGRLIRFDGVRERQLRDLRPLRLGGISSDIVILNGGLIWLEGRTRAALLRADGALVSRLTFPDPRSRSLHRFGPPESPFANPSGSAVALVRTRGEPAANEVVVVDRSGTPRVVYRHAANHTGCEYWASVQWRGPWLLYTTNREEGAVIDTSGRRRPINLTRLMSRLGTAAGDGVDASWAKEGGSG